MSLVLQTLTRYRGDGSTLSLSLTHPDTGAAFTPTGYALLFTVKRKLSDPDSAAKCQKLSSVGGLTVANPALVTLVAADFGDLLLRPGLVYEWDVQAQPNAGGSPLTVARGTLFFAEDVSKELGLSVTTYTTNPSSLLNKVDTIPAAPTSAGTINQYAIDEDGILYLCVITGTEGNALWLKFNGAADWA